MEPSNSPRSGPPAAALNHERERTIAALCEHFAHDHLETEELERRLDAAHRAASRSELAALLQDLPAPAAPAPHPAARDLAAGGGHSARDHQLVVAIMGGVERKGGWIPARQIQVVALTGGARLDFREARLHPGVTEISVLALMGGVEIVVPPGLEVHSNGIGIMGGFEHVGHGRFPVDASVPVLRITGIALMGGVTISVRLPGERPRDAHERLREQQRQLRAEHRRPR